MKINSTYYLFRRRIYAFSVLLLTLIILDFMILLQEDSDMTKKQRAIAIIERLKKEYPDAGCTLEYSEAWKLLVSVRLAAQCTDARVNIVTKDLFRKYVSLSDLANAKLEELEQYIHSTGFYHNKAKNIIACARMLMEEYGG